jgi:hypothetical protein
MSRNIHDLTTSESLSLKASVVANADFVRAEEFTGIIINRGRRWLALIPGCPCCAPRGRWGLS